MIQFITEENYLQKNQLKMYTRKALSSLLIKTLKIINGNVVGTYNVHCT